ncbi:DNA-binding transcriptional regulator, MerR family [Paenibacillus sp. UNCCL117]|nr:DNA-binding transcriptional regulator, MerR family [Paenibacillus sp. cl123]SFW16675.1 DNA-binding transcriptional regulator, MerR family [Paenibacillus sp. UNCCL117]
MLGMSKDTLRYYDRIGVVSPFREDNGYRRYSKNDLINLMNIQIMQYADFSLDEIRGKFSFPRSENIDPAYCEEVAAFIDAKNAETRKKIDRLEKVSRLLSLAAETLKDFNNESDQRLAEFVRELYQDIRNNEPAISREGCSEHED